MPCASTGHMLYVVRCPRCGLVYQSPRPSSLVGKQYFEDAYRGVGQFSVYPYHLDHGRKSEKFRKKLEGIESLNPSSHRLFDLGAGQGHFVSYLQIPGGMLLGIEISPAAR